jgi:hypothetical protein
MRQPKNNKIDSHGENGRRKCYGIVPEFYVDMGKKDKENSQTTQL